MIPLGLTAASAADARMHTKILGSAAATLIISYDEIEGIMKIVRYLEDSCLLLKEAKKKIQNEAKEQERGFLGMLFLEDMLTGKGFIRVGYGSEQSKKIKGVIRIDYGSKRSLIKDF